MSIVKMDKITIVGISSEKEEVLSALMNLGAMEISEKCSEKFVAQFDKETLLQNETNNEFLDREVRDMQNTMAVMKRAIDIADGYLHEKKQMFSSKRKISASRFEQTVKQADEILEKAKELDEISSQVSTLKALIFRLRILLDQLRPWQNIPIRLDKMETGDTDIYLGSIAGQIEYNELIKQLTENAPESITKIVFQGSEVLGLMVIAWKQRKDIINRTLKDLKFLPLHMPDMQGTPGELYTKYSQEISLTQERIEAIYVSLTEYSKSKELFEILYDDALIRLRKTLSASKLVRTEYTYTLCGFAPSHLTSSIRKALDERFCVAVHASAVSQEDDYPILLKNHPLIRPYEVVTEMFSTPSSKDIDPNPLLAPFFLFFFSLMLSDSGYGMLLAAGCAFLIWKVQVTGNTRSMCMFLFHGGLASVLWGLLFGGFFGDLVTALTKGSYSFPSIWFNPIENPTKLMIWSMIFGTVHLLAGMGAKGMILIMTGKIWDAVCDIFSWYLVILGLGGLIAGMVVNQPIISEIGKYSSIVGVLIIVLFSGRTTKNPILRVLKGLTELYGITGYFSDILSYTRILALSLATSVIAMVVNLIGGIAGSGFIGILIFVLVALIGHGMNLAISALGCYVHTSRLQYVEFFSKFYEGGGRTWDPLTIKTEYIQIVS
jgi:V/A-type H+/Na+-transporting ATPase subunit I